MKQEEKWVLKYNEVVEFINTNHRNPSKHRIEEHDYLNWLKANRKALNAGRLRTPSPNLVPQSLGERLN